MIKTKKFKFKIEKEEPKIEKEPEIEKEVKVIFFDKNANPDNVIGDRVIILKSQNTAYYMGKPVDDYCKNPKVIIEYSDIIYPQWEKEVVEKGLKVIKSSPDIKDIEEELK